MSEEDNKPYGTCDWGGCDDEVVRWRYSVGMGVHLPVCHAHSLEVENARLREQADALEAAVLDIDAHATGLNNRLIAFFRNNVEGRHGNDAEGEPCDLLMETEYSGPYHPDTGVPLCCTCGYDVFEAVLRVVIPAWFEEGQHE